jgi:cell division protein FtsI/penicillin-binding protein 2
MSRTFVSPWRLILLTTLMVAGFGGVLARLVHLHVFERAVMRGHVADLRQMTVAQGARRGDILDSRGNVLATTRPRYHLGVDPQSFDPGRTDALRQLATELGVDGSELVRRVRTLREAVAERPVRWVKITEVDPEIYEIIRRRDIPGVYGNLYYERFYPAGSFAAHVIGFLNREGTAVMGVERYLDFYLQGQGGWRETEADVHRREMAQFRSREVEARPGFDVELTLDLVVQSYVEEALQHLVEKYQPEGASIIVSDPFTGDILALGNYPSLDLNAFWQYELGAHRNRAVSDLLEPGSTFKIVPVAAALEERLVNPRTLIDCSLPVVEHRGRSLRLPSDSSELGSIPVIDVVAKSSNRGAAQLGLLLGEERLHAYSERFGFGRGTDWALTGEATGTLHPVKSWDGLTITRLPAGYAVNATPMQVHLAMASIANGGQLLTPRLVRRVRDAQGRTLVEFPRQVRERVVSERNARMLAAMLTRVVSDEGTARRAAIPGFQVAGKTGTSRKIIDGRYSTRHHFASFSGFFPAHAPEIAITVVVDDAKLSGVAYGGVVAAPVFREIGEKLIEYYAMNPPSERPSGLLAYLGREVAP